MFHPPIIIACAIALHELTLPGPYKAVLLTLLATITTFFLSAQILRKIPYLRAVI
jgi:hypothetical protein